MLFRSLLYADTWGQSSPSSRKNDRNRNCIPVLLVIVCAVYMSHRPHTAFPKLIVAYGTEGAEYEYHGLGACSRTRSQSASRVFESSRAGTDVVYPHRGMVHFSQKAALSAVFDLVYGLVLCVGSRLQWGIKTAYFMLAKSINKESSWIHTNPSILSDLNFSVVVNWRICRASLHSHLALFSCSILSLLRRQSLLRLHRWSTTHPY